MKYFGYQEIEMAQARKIPRSCCRAKACMQAALQTFSKVYQVPALHVRETAHHKTPRFEKFTFVC